MSAWLLPWCFGVPLIAILAIVPFSLSLSRQVAWALAAINLLLPALFYLSPDSSWVDTLPYLSLAGGPLPLQLDSWNLPFLLLIKTATLLALPFLSDRLGRTEIACLFFADFALAGSLLSIDAFAGLFFSQMSVVPLCLLIAAWGAYDRLFASRKFFLAQTAGCLLCLAALALKAAAHEGQFGFTSGLPVDLAKATSTADKAAFLCFLAGCLLRSAVFPLHSWLADTLAQAPLSAALYLVAGVLPSGALALVRQGLPIFPAGFEAVQGPAAAIAAGGSLYLGLIAWRQNDSHRYLAFAASVLLTLVFGASLMPGPVTWVAAGYLLFTSSLALAALFVLFEWAFRRQKSRQFPDWGGMGAALPRFRALLVFLVGSLLALPGTAAFPGAFALLVAALAHNSIWCASWLFSLLLLAACGTRLIGTVAFGAPRREPLTAGPDLSTLETLRIAWIALLLLLLGLLPQRFLSSMETPIRNFWEETPESRRFLVPGDEGRSTLPRAFKKEGEP